jgi:hypothetical protein
LLNIHGALGPRKRDSAGCGSKPAKQLIENIKQEKLCNIDWLVVSTHLKNMKVSWDDEIPDIWKNKIHVPNQQPD